ncbi:sulfate adenylyltransferase subunit CysN [Roseivirga pacifica]|uniref:sulfate adenylyltransferase subunit CysN n=1 Tax=Roseivirga pacifica TaxID=1267423 RepID=UPI0020942D18|nr:sulfate adenylyltransferase subunit CysN [Roseivirga pacifica]MCO6359470.1 sulfate adenylyltransferase subunit CysN [Roseivirga pacifica]MCO6366840.1 sulfate adenylyltransferase subunit CysN [Roseivirga pacifica]MCO6370628.1 sulfate adenylyltransferase subunit CysN [Roseivirga pacifica]MCO6374496.1 sulfate adenylyltransferase subunit CysN [Roseivirga pacifica]MCO6379755.1 sulfate adenylyltransferase subunit CysN [Roseivirga pacifica]
MEKSYLDMELLRFTTAGSVDDGKSTLIGRLLFDSKSIFEDQLDHVASSSKKRGLEHTDLALLTDGLKDEREQGITIDVAYRYFATPKRKFIIADTPGHIQYTRNMVTGASTANLALILIDARKGIVEQTCRHSFIASLLQIPHIVVCVNKMDLVDHSEEAFEKIKSDYKDFAAKLDVKDIRFIPISALNGDNVVNRSENMPWYEGATLLNTLETIHIASDYNHIDGRFPVQTVLRPKSDKYHDYRGYAGRIAGGIFKKGDEVTVLPSGFTSKVKQIHLMEEEIEEAFAPMSVAMTLEDDIDLGRGDMIVKIGNQPNVSQDVDVMLCWFSPQGPQVRSKYTLMHASNEVKAMVKNIHYKLDINTLHKEESYDKITLNDIIKVSLRTTKPIMNDSYRKNRSTGALILVDESTNETVAAGMIV